MAHGQFFFHSPSFIRIFSFAVNVEDFLREGVKEIPSLVGAKFSSPDLVDMIGCVNLEAPNREDKKFNIVFGCDAVICFQLNHNVVTTSNASTLVHVNMYHGMHLNPNDT